MPNDQAAIDELRSKFEGLPGQLVVISGPSAGAGKGKVIDEIRVFAGDKLWLSVSTTTREPRPGDVLHHKYTFASREEFEELERSRGFFEANGHTEGARYGTPLEPILEHLRRGVTVILEMDIYGGQYVHQVLPDGLFVFIKPTDGTDQDDVVELRRRLEHRGTNDAASIERRLEQAAGELDKVRDLDFYTWVVNATGKSEQAAKEIYGLILSRAQA